MDQLPPFPGFREEGFAFLKDLKANNQRDWFKPRKATFDDELLWPLRCLIADASRAAPGAGLPLKGDPSKSLFRIYRDTRFSKNKDPYKTHLGAVLSRSGSRKASGGVYIHVEPGGCFVAAGFWQPEKELLRGMRERIVSRPDEFREVVSQLGGRQLDEHFGTLKRLPRGFTEVEDPEIGAYIKHKAFMVSTQFADEDLQNPGFTGTLLDSVKEMKSLLEWGWSVLDDASSQA